MSTKPLNQIEAAAFIKANNLARARLTDTAVDLTRYASSVIEIKQVSEDPRSEFPMPVIFPGGGNVKINNTLSSFKNITVTGVLQSFEVELRTKTLHGCPATSKLILTTCDTLESFEGAPSSLIEMTAGYAAGLKGLGGLPASLNILKLDLFNNVHLSFEHVPDSVQQYELQELRTKPFKVKYPKNAMRVGIDGLNNIGELMLLPRLLVIHYTGRTTSCRHRDVILELSDLINRSSNPKARYYEAQQLLIEHDMDDFF